MEDFHSRKVYSREELRVPWGVGGRVPWLSPKPGILESLGTFQWSDIYFESCVYLDSTNWLRRIPRSFNKWQGSQRAKEPRPEDLLDAWGDCQGWSLVLKSMSKNRRDSSLRCNFLSVVPYEPCRQSWVKKNTSRSNRFPVSYMHVLAYWFTIRWYTTSFPYYTVLNSRLFLGKSI